jgi:glycosyltransferase involved in cell wall biosynthesis
MTDLGVKCTVIHPASLTRYFGRQIPAFHSKKKTKQGNDVDVFRPRYLSFSAKRFMNVNTASWTLKSFTTAAENFLRRRNLYPDALYGHFIYPSGIAVSLISARHRIPAFCAVGEGEPWTIRMLGPERTRRLINGNLHPFAVSTKARKMLVEYGLGREEDIPVIPNGVDLDTFRPMDRKGLREKYGFPPDAFIIGFVGKFIDGKGFHRLNEALQSIKGVYAIFIGSGSAKTDPETTLFKGQIAHHEVPLILNCADIFVLPTLIEGCSNAIIEALACGLPVVSSNYEFNDAILNDDCSIRIDPLSVQEIRQAILKLKNDPGVRRSMSKAALHQASQLDLRLRAQKILAWMEAKICNAGIK